MWGGSGSASLDGQGDRMHDYFMAELAALMSRGLRHVISPPTGVWRRYGVRMCGEQRALAHSPVRPTNA
eukprot:74635-Chlamydomonas_euryale.AAC.2